MEENRTRQTNRRDDGEICMLRCFDINEQKDRASKSSATVSMSTV